MTIDWQALHETLTIELSTRGRRSGKWARIEIWWFFVDGRFIITGTPGPRDWYANVLSDPRVLVHVGDVELEAMALPVTDPAARRRVLTHRTTSWYSTQAELDALVAGSPMIEVQLKVDEARP